VSEHAAPPAKHATPQGVATSVPSPQSVAVSGHEAPAAEPGFLQRHHFLLRRLHSLSGIVPAGIFVIMHLFTNFQMWPAIFDPRAPGFQHEVGFIHSLPALLILEISIWLGIGFHAILGLVYTFTGNNKWGVPESTHYHYFDSWRYVLQRVTGILALIFILFHVATLRWRWSLPIQTPFYVTVNTPEGEVKTAMASTALALQYGWWVVALYVIGAYSVIYHWCNGLWTAAISWGLTVSVAAMRRWGAVCAALGVVLAVFSAGAILGALRYQPSERERQAIRYAIDNPDAAHSGSAIEEAATGKEELTPELH
jgi:succinate dehydrogenase / fumarate reductase, cytochrome b subunit